MKREVKKKEIWNKEKSGSKELGGPIYVTNKQEREREINKFEVLYIFLKFKV